MDVRMFTVGPFAENSFLIRADGSDEAVFIDPGAEAPKLLGAIQSLGVEVKAILLTHTHIDHIGAVKPVAEATGAPVYCPVLEVESLQDPASILNPALAYEVDGYTPEHTLSGGEKLELAGLEVEVLFTPGHSPGHLTYAIAGERAIFSGDVLFQSSVGRTDLPGGSHATLLASIAMLLEKFDDETVVHPGHMGLTTLGRERATNPFLQELPR
jgi:glyoxylase-like metal-dependent hydrolase (beta-lactamase superfamily II)